MPSADVAAKPAAKAAEKKPDAKADGKREKRTITEIREFEKDRREDGLHVGAGLHLGAMGRDGRRRRCRARRQPGDDLARSSAAPSRPPWT